jgi:hypothetical protein
MYVKWLILVVVLVLHLSIMCNPEESVEAEVRITERLAAYVLIFHCVLFTCFLIISVSHGREKTPVLGLVSCQLFLYHTVFRQNVCTALLLAVHETKLLF